MNVITAEVRGTSLRLAGYTRALELCARMNRETEVLDFIDEIRPGEILYDLGACEGRFAVYAALRGVRCYAFEPEAMNFRALLDNIELNRDALGSRLTPLNCAVGANAGAAKLLIAQPWAGGHQRVIEHGGRVDLKFDFTTEQTVEIVALDNSIAIGKLLPPNYMKIDIDGSELPFMTGAATTLRSASLKGLMFELQSRDASYQDIVDDLASCGFAISGRYEVESELFNVWFRRNGRGI
jgi:FkbM family methyltransferase